MTLAEEILELCQGPPYIGTRKQILAAIEAKLGSWVSGHQAALVRDGRPNCQPFYACPNCWHTMSYSQVHDQAKDECPKCHKGNMLELEKLQIPAPSVGCELLCLLCAFYKPWGIFSSATGEAICLECATNARRASGHQALGLVCEAELGINHYCVLPLGHTGLCLYQLKEQP